jgi:hypothetical protein
MRRRLRGSVSIGVALAAGFLMAGCAVSGISVSPHSSSITADPETGQALLRIAIQFNHNYAANRDGLVYDRWDASSRMIISRAQYVRRHVLCPTAPDEAIVESASPAAGGYWRVRYSIGGVHLIDYWHYVHGQWRFCLTRSNPDAVKLYKLPFAAYAKAVGCVLAH